MVCSSQWLIPYYNSNAVRSFWTKRNLLETIADRIRLFPGMFQLNATIFRFPLAAVTKTIQWHKALLMSRDMMLFDVIIFLLPRLSFLFQLPPAVFVGFCSVKERLYVGVELSQGLVQRHNQIKNSPNNISGSLPIRHPVCIPPTDGFHAPYPAWQLTCYAWSGTQWWLTD